MFTKSQTDVKLDAEIESLLEKLAQTDKTSDEYGVLVERITKLHKLQTEDRPKRISPDTALVVAANLIGILWLTSYEQEKVIKARSALGFVMKPR
jgi:hypothetical protein